MSPNHSSWPIPCVLFAAPSKANENAMKRRRGIARKAIPELAALGWTVSEYAKN
ncbi:replication protein C, IncQ-type, partial [Aeromonas caviae]|uniref:replication protein C, IncQ-type n=1 Tax=Aeromonas caviae TaxID=648 RepID=UPI0022A75EAC